MSLGSCCKVFAHFVRCIAWCGKDAAPSSPDTKLQSPVVLERSLTFVPAYGHYLSCFKARIRKLLHHGTAETVVGGALCHPRLLTDCR